MRRSLLTFLMLLTTLPQAAGARAAPDRDLCAALSNLATEAAAKGKIQTVSVIKPAIAEVAMGCQRSSRSAVQVAFCDAVMEHVSFEIIHGFPWQISDCLRADGATVATDTVDEYTGLGDSEKIVRLRSTLGSGVAIDVQFTPAANSGGKPGERLHGLYGRYDLTLTPRP